MDTFEHKQHSRDALNGAIAVTISIVGFALNYLLNLLFSRHLSAEAYGDLYIIIKIIILCAFLCTFGTTASIVRFMPSYVDKNQLTKAHGYLRWNNKLVFRVTLILTIVGALLAATSFVLDKLNIYTLDDVHPVIFAFWLIPLYAFNRMTNSRLQGFRKVNTSLFFRYINLYILEIGLLLLFLIFFKVITIYHILFLMGITYMTITLIQYIVLRSETYYKVTSKIPEYTESNSWSRYSKAMLANNLLSFLSSVVIVIIFETIGKHESQVGAFAAINTIVSILSVISAAINSLAAPSFSAQAKEPIKLQATVNKSVVLRLIITLPIAIAIAIFAAPILRSFNPAFTQYASELSVIVILYFASIQFSAATCLLVYAGAVKLEVYSNILYLIMAFSFSFLLIPHLQLMGAILSIGFSLLIAYLFDFIACKRTLNIKTLYFV